MWSIHPKQIQPILTAFAPDEQEITQAIAILSAAKKAAWGPIHYNQHLHDRASYRYYWMLLKRAHTHGICLSEAALQLV